MPGSRLRWNEWITFHAKYCDLSPDAWVALTVIGFVLIVLFYIAFLIATFRGEALGEPFEMFDFTPVGAACALAGVLFVTLVLVSFGQIGHITLEFLPRIRARVQRELGLDPANLVFNVNHGHGVPCDDVEERTFSAIAAAAASMVPVALGTGRGHEDRIQENRRMFLKRTPYKALSIRST